MSCDWLTGTWLPGFPALQGTTGSLQRICIVNQHDPPLQQARVPIPVDPPLEQGHHRSLEQAIVYYIY